MFVIAGKFHRRRIIAPKGEKTRPTASRLRETVFNILQNDIENSEFLDIFAGSGAMGIEALSRGAKHATFIEVSYPALKCLKTNLEQLNISSYATVLAGDFMKGLSILERSAKQFDVIFADAPYQMVKNNVSVSLFLAEWIATHELLKPLGHFFIENAQKDPPLLKGDSLHLQSSRRSGKAFLHYYTHNSSK